MIGQKSVGSSSRPSDCMSRGVPCQIDDGFPLLGPLLQGHYKWPVINALLSMSMPCRPHSSKRDYRKHQRAVNSARETPARRHPRSEVIGSANLAVLVGLGSRD